MTHPEFSFSHHRQSMTTPRRLLYSLDLLAKRGLDIVVSAFGLLLLAPFFAWIAWRIRRDSPGPVIFRGLRLGRHGRTFHILKFRTMYETPESYRGPRVTAGNDPRVTHFGRWLRATKLNELPQLWNVLKGEMSLVGPRPEDPALGKSWPKELLDEVLSVRPGITSPASVLYRNEESLLPSQPASSHAVTEAYLESILPSKQRLDQLYVRNRSILLDLDILFWTALVMVARENLYQPAEQSLFGGPFSDLFSRNLNWLVIDTLVTLAAMGLAGVIWRSSGPLNVGILKSLALALGFAMLFGLNGALLRFTQESRSRSAWRDVLALVPAAAVATAIALAANRLLGVAGPLFPTALVLIASGLALLGFGLARYGGRLVGALAARWLKLRGEARAAQERILIIGGGQAGQFVAWLLGSGASASVLRVEGFIDDDLFKQGLHIHGAPVLGRREDIPRLVQEHDIGILVFAIHNIQADERQRLLKICEGTPARLVLMPDILGMLAEAAAHDPVNGGSLFPPTWQGVSKRQGAEAVGQSSRLNPNGHHPDLGRKEVESWLNELAELAQSGDVERVNQQIRSFLDRLKESD